MERSASFRGNRDGCGRESEPCGRSSSRTPRSTKCAEGGTVGVYVQGPKYLFVCESAGNAELKDFKDKLDVCKTIAPIGG